MVDFPPWVVPNLGSLKGTAIFTSGMAWWEITRPLPKSQSGQTQRSFRCLVTILHPHPHLSTCCSEVGSHCSFHLRNTLHPVLNPLRKMKNFGLFFALVS